jgi:hypothetical protein
MRCVLVLFLACRHVGELEDIINLNSKEEVVGFAELSLRAHVEVHKHNTYLYMHTCIYQMDSEKLFMKS